MSIASSAPVRAVRMAWLAGALGAATLPVPAQQPTAAQTSAIRQACSGNSSSARRGRGGFAGGGRFHR